MKRIFWVTSSNFFDVDEKIVPALSKQYDISWYILCFKQFFYTKEYLENALKQHGIKGEVVECPRIRTFAAAKIHFNLARKYKKGKYDIGYFDYLGMPYLVSFLKVVGASKSRTIFACHDFLEHIGSPNFRSTSWYKRKLFKRFPNIHFLSRSQMALYADTYKNGHPHFAPMTLKDFGKPTHSYAATDKIRFLFFGRIENRKGLEYVIEAGNKLYKKYPDKFIIKIAGGCKDWSKYQELITEPNAFDLDIRRIGNEEIPDLLSDADFMLLPYKEVTQSGPLFISYNYNLPIIASDHPGFREFIDNGKTGLLFENMDSEDLARVMAEVIDGRYNISQMRSDLARYIQNNLSTEAVAKQYKQMFESIC